MRLFGEDAAREMMGHAPDSRTLEQYYVELRSSKNVAAAALDENIEARQAKDITEESVLALNQITAEDLAQTQGHVLNAQYRQMVAADQSKPAFATALDAKNYERRMRRAALLAVMKAAQDEVKASMTVIEHEQRTLRLQDISDFMQAVKKHAVEASRNPAQADETEVAGINLEQDFPEVEGVKEPAGQDAEETEADARGVASIEPPLEDDDPTTEAGEEASNLAMVEAFMESLLENQYSQHQPRKDFRETCVLCNQDETVELERKQKIWTWSRLQEHMRSKFHSPYDRFWRQREMEANRHEFNYFECPYCNELAPTGASKPYFTKRERLFTHLDRSTSDSIVSQTALSGWQKQDEFAAKHDALKAQDGWYKDDWKGDVEHRTRQAKKETKRRRQSFEDDIGVTYSNVEQLTEPVPSKSHPLWLQHGSTPGQLEAALAEHVAAGWFEALLYQ